MANRLLVIVVIVLGLLFTATTYNLTQAQTKSTSYAYIEMLKHMLFNKKSTMPSTSLSITPTPTIYTKPTVTPTRKLTKTVTNAPTNPTGDVNSFIMREINNYRASQGLTDVSTSTQICNFAAIRASEIITSFNHDGFQNRINSKTLPYTSWSKVTENIAMTSDYKQVVTMWINSPGHAANMRADTPYVCVMQNGAYYAYEGMKP